MYYYWMEGAQVATTDTPTNTCGLNADNAADKRQCNTLPIMKETKTKAGGELGFILRLVSQTLTNMVKCNKTK